MKVQNTFQYMAVGFQYIFGIMRMLWVKICFPGRYKGSIIQLIPLRTGITIERGCKLIIKGKISVRTGCNLYIIEGGTLTIENGVFLNHNCMIACMSEITIKKSTFFGPGAMIFDHNHKFYKNIGVTGEHSFSPIQIGEHTWIGAGAIILKGVSIGDRCVVGAGTVCSPAPRVGGPGGEQRLVSAFVDP